MPASMAEYSKVGRTARSPVDGLTVMERRVVKAVVDNPKATPEQLIVMANVGGSTKESRIKILRKTLQKPIVMAAIGNPPSTVTEPTRRTPLDLSDPAVLRPYLLRKWQEIVDSKTAPHGARIQALDDIKTLVLGKTPQAIKLSGEIRSIADVVQAANLVLSEDDEPTNPTGTRRSHGQDGASQVEVGAPFGDSRSQR